MKEHTNTPFKIALLYFLIGSLWIIFSDIILSSVITDVKVMTKVEIYKGWFFVAITAILLFFIVKRYVRKIESQKEYNRLLFEKSPIGLALCELDGRLVDVNEAYAKIIGRSIEETLKLSYWDITPEKYLKQEKEQLNFLYTKGNFGPYEKEYIHKDGHTVSVRLYGRILEKDGKKYIWSSVEDITEIKKLENTLKEESLRLKLALQSSRAGVWEWDIKKGEIIWSEENYLILGYEPYIIKPTYLTWIERIHPDDREKVNNVISDAVNNKKDLDMEFRILLPDGTIRWLNCKGKLVMDSSCNPEKMYGIQIDITKQKLAEESFREAYDKLSKVVATTPGIVFSFRLKPDGSSCFPLGWKRLAETYGIPNARLDESARPFFDLVHPDDLEGLMVSIVESAKNLSKWRYEWRVIHPEYGVMWIEVNSIPERELDGSVLWYGVATDITSRKNAEIELRKTNEELYLINKIITTTTTIANIKTILSNVLDEVLNFIDLEGGTICLVSSEGTLELAEARNTSDTVIKDLTENVIKIGDCLCGNCAKEKKPLILWSREEVLKYSTREAQRGEDIRFHCAFPLVSADRCLGVLCVFTRGDKKPTERELKIIESICPQIAIAIDNAMMFQKIKSHSVELEKKVQERTKELDEKHQELIKTFEILKEKTMDLERANEKLKELDRLKSMFIASMSHELRTPLNSIIGFTSIVLNEWVGNLNDEQKENLSIVLRSGKHLLNLINDVIDISKIEAGTIDYQYTDFDVYDVLSEIENIFKKDALDKGLDFSVVKIHQKLFTDKRRLLQCVMNLVSNAIKFTERGSVKVESIVKEDRFLEIIVEDTGIGIDKDEIQYLFEPFVRLETPLKAKIPGTGLGLYLTKKILKEVLNGEIFVSSEKGKGSIFKIKLEMRRS